MPTGDGRRRRTGHRAQRTGVRRRAAPPATPGLDDGRQWNEFLSSAAVILAGVLVVIGFGFVAARALNDDEETPPPLAGPPAPALGDVRVPTPGSQGLIPLGSATPSATPSRTATVPPPVKLSPSPDPGSVRVVSGSVPARVDLAAEGSRDWVHWGLNGTFSLERDEAGGFAILEGTPTAPRFKHALSPQRFRWTGGDPVASSDGTPTGIRTCGESNGFTLSAPAGSKQRTLKVYVGVVAARGRLTATLSTGTARDTTVVEQRTGTFRGAVLTVAYRAPESGRLNLTWTTDAAFGNGCGGVALEAATLR